MKTINKVHSTIVIDDMCYIEVGVTSERAHRQKFFLFTFGVGPEYPITVKPGIQEISREEFLEAMKKAEK